MRLLAAGRRLLPVAAFFAGFIWDALTIGQRMRPFDFWRLGALLACAAMLTIVLARRETRGAVAPDSDRLPPARRLAWIAWQAPYLLLQACFGGIFSALFLLYFKSSGHLGTWLTALVLGGLLVANEFAGKHYGRRFTLTWTLFVLNAILLGNFALPHALGSLDPHWFYVSTIAGVALTWCLRRIAAGRAPPLGRVGPAFALAGVLLLAWTADMIAPVPLVKRKLALGHNFVQDGKRFLLQVEARRWWEIWRSQSAIVHLAQGGRLYGVSAVFAPLGVAAALEHRWEFLDETGWRVAARSAFQTTGGRERGFRGYSWVVNPEPGEWRLVVATQDGRTIGILRAEVRLGQVNPGELRSEDF